MKISRVDTLDKATGNPICIRTVTHIAETGHCGSGDCRLITFRPNNIEIISVTSKLSTSRMILVPKMVQLEALRPWHQWCCIQLFCNILSFNIGMISASEVWGWLTLTFVDTCQQISYFYPYFILLPLYISRGTRFWSQTTSCNEPSISVSHEYLSRNLV